MRRKAPLASVELTPASAEIAPSAAARQHAAVRIMLPLMDTNYTSAFILVSPDTTATNGITPTKSSSIAGLQYDLLFASPYELASDELLFEVYTRRKEIAANDRDQALSEFSAKSHACLRASPLVKSYGWGIHHDENSKIAIVGMETERYRALAERTDLEVRPGMRSRRSK